MLVSTPESTPLLEAQRASQELRDLGVANQLLIINGVLAQYDEADEVEKAFFQKQQAALAGMPEALRSMKKTIIPLRAYNITGIENVRRFLSSDEAAFTEAKTG